MTDYRKLIADDIEREANENHYEADASEEYYYKAGANRYASLLAEALEALDWYEKWDWSDKYVQAIPKKATKTIAEITAALSTMNEAEINLENKITKELS